MINNVEVGEKRLFANHTGATVADHDGSENFSGLHGEFPKVANTTLSLLGKCEHNHSITGCYCRTWISFIYRWNVEEGPNTALVLHPRVY
jgi:hypothetical protein